MTSSNNFITNFFCKKQIKLTNFHEFNIYVVSNSSKSFFLLDYIKTPWLINYIYFLTSINIKLKNNLINATFLNTKQGANYYNKLLMFISYYYIFYKQLALKGTGFKAIYNPIAKRIDCKLGSTDKKQLILSDKKDCELLINKTTIIFIGYFKDFIGNISAEFKRLKEPNAYTGKGVINLKTSIKLKPTKKQ